MTQHYRTIITGCLQQESALTVGGNQPHALVDMPLARDGRGEPVLRGTTLAGVFIQTARRILGRPLPPTISASSQEQELETSRWHFEHAHLENPASTLFCQHVGINQRTGATADDLLFNLEAVPRGSRWHFHMEIAPQPDDKETDTREDLVLQVLREWARPGGCRLGRGSRHGYGWLQLQEQDIRIWRLDMQHQSLWPNARLAPDNPQALVDYFAQHGITPLDMNSYAAQVAAQAVRPEHNPAVVVELSGTIHVGERRTGYGLDSLSIGGHARLLAQADRFLEQEKINRPQGITLNPDDFDPDFVITAANHPDGKLEPYIPGASQRGVWRAGMSRWLRAKGIEVHNPADNAPTDKPRNLVERLFGSTSHAGKLSLADAYPKDADWLLAWQQHVAIDEFTGGAFESSKFDRLALIKARFAWHARIEADSESEAEELKKPIEDMLRALGSRGHLPLGGGQWRGHGHVEWTLDACQMRRLGEPS